MRSLLSHLRWLRSYVTENHQWYPGCRFQRNNPLPNPSKNLMELQELHAIHLLHKPLSSGDRQLHIQSQLLRH